MTSVLDDVEALLQEPVAPSRVRDFVEKLGDEDQKVISELTEIDVAASEQQLFRQLAERCDRALLALEASMKMQADLWEIFKEMQAIWASRGSGEDSETAAIDNPENG